MATFDPSTTKFTNPSDPTIPYRLETSDNLGTVLVTDIITTDNYSTWSHSIQRALRAKNNLGFLN